MSRTEIKEELGIKIKVKEIFEYFSHLHGEKHVIFGFLCKLISGRYFKRVHA